MAGVALDRLDVAAVQLQFISDAGMAETVENHLREVMRFYELCKLLPDHRRFPRRSAGAADHQVVIRVLITESFSHLILFPFMIHQHLRHCPGQEYLPYTALGLRCLQDQDRHGAFTL